MRIIELTSAEVVKVVAPHAPEFIGIKTREEVSIAITEVGIIVGKKSMMLRGVLCQSGVVHPGWVGKLEPFFVVYGNWVIGPGAAIAHVVILP